MNIKLIMVMLCMTIASSTTLQLFSYTNFADKMPDRGLNVEDLGAESEEQDFAKEPEYLHCDCKEGCDKCDYKKNCNDAACKKCQDCHYNENPYLINDVKDDL